MTFAPSTMSFKVVSSPERLLEPNAFVARRVISARTCTAISMFFFLFLFEDTEERVLAWRTEPLREVSTEFGVIWKALRATVGQMFDAIDNAAASMT